MSCETVYFAVIEGSSLAPDLRDSLCVAVLEYQHFMLVGDCEALLVDLARVCHTTVGIRPLCVLASEDALLLTVEHFLEFAHPATPPPRNYLKVCLQEATVTTVPQLRDSNFSLNTDHCVVYTPSLQGLHPVVKHTVETACWQYTELSRLIARLLIGYSFLSDAQLRAKGASSDLDGLQLQELQGFLSHLSSLAPSLGLLQDEISRLVLFAHTLLAVCPANAAALDNTHPTPALQNGFPCVYKVMSVFHYLAYELALQRKLYNKAFMHIFRAFECYASGALFLNNATIAPSFNKKKRVTLDSYLVDNKRISGFGTVFEGIGTHFNLLLNNDYLTCKFHIELRNKFHYTHGDSKPSATLLAEFATAVARQIDDIETAALQHNFLWRNIYNECKKHFCRLPQSIVPQAIRRALKSHQMTFFMVP
ncbi:hypothetical protein [Pseudomonas sp. VEM90]